MSEHLLLQLHESDNVAVALTALKAGTEVSFEGGTLETSENIPAFHKVALTSMDAGETVTKYGSPIGRLSQQVGCGDWVHTHNLVSALGGAQAYTYHPRGETPRSESGPDTFSGFVRMNGAAGTRNELWVLNTVGCVNKTAEVVARRCEELAGSTVDGVVAFPHPLGCSQLGDDLENTRRIVAGLLRHPNVGGVLLIGLGCEENSVDELLETTDGLDRSRIRYFLTQEVDDEIEHGVMLGRELLRQMEGDRRSERPVSDLVIGLQCGGSDALSGISANPLVGRVTDRLVDQAGAAILAEVPEMFGAEQDLMDRAADEGVFQDIVNLINAFKASFEREGVSVGDNPSPSNVAGGISTLEEKALGATRKGGTAMVTSVLRYGEHVRTAGLSLLETPGNDAVSNTALVAAGATALLFTTGRGTPLGSPIPTIKISSNTPIYAKKPRWFDFDAGELVSGTADISMLEDRLYTLLLEVASGRKRTQSEVNGYRDMAIWKRGVTL